MAVAGQAKLYIGTSGWSYPKGEGSWTGYFYPRGRIDELSYYSQFFNAVEINSSFYKPPSPEHVYKWVCRAPPDFLFTAKLWQKFTHPKMFFEATGSEAAISQKDVDIFKSSLEPLVRSGKLGALLAQFPPSFKNDGYGQQILRAVIKTFGHYRLVVELRHCSWSDDPNTAKLLTENNVTWVQIDEPKFKFSIAQDLPLTSDIAYFRFHGRNTESWWQGDSETRYKYLYSNKEIDELSQRVTAAGRQTKLAFAFFNNHWQGYAPRNAIDMMRTLELPIKELPVQTVLPEESMTDKKQ